MSATTLSVVASAVFLLRLLPQPIRLWRSGVADGVSPLAAFNGVLVTVAWLVYGLVMDLPAVWIVSAMALLPGIWQAVLLIPQSRRVDVLGAVALAGVVLVAAMTETLGAALGLGVVVSTGPQVVTALRGRELDGISPLTWWVSIIDATLWGCYGVLMHDAALIGYGAVLAGFSVLVLVRLAVTHVGERRADRSAAAQRSASASSRVSAR